MSILAVILVPNTSLVALYLIQVYGIMAFLISYMAKKYTEEQVITQLLINYYQPIYKDFHKNSI